MLDLLVAGRDLEEGNQLGSGGRDRHGARHAQVARSIEALAPAEKELVALIDLFGGEMRHPLGVHIAPHVGVRGGQQAQGHHPSGQPGCEAMATHARISRPSARRPVNSGRNMDITISESNPSATFTASRSWPSTTKPSPS